MSTEVYSFPTRQSRGGQANVSTSSMRAGRAVYTVREVAELLTLSIGGTYQLVREGVIPAIHLGSRWVIPKERFHAWLDSFESGKAS